MNNKLPVYIENLELPIDDNKKEIDSHNKNSYGYVSIIYILSMMITIGSVLAIFVFRKS